MKIRLLTRKLLAIIFSLTLITNENSAFAFSLPFFKNKNIQSYDDGNATQNNVDNQPDIDTGTMSKLPTLTFDGNNDFLNYNGSNLVGKNYTLFIVETRASNKSNNYILGTTSTGTSPNHNLIFGYKSDTAIVVAQGSVEKIIPIQPYSSSNPKTTLHAFVHDNKKGTKYYRNGALAYSDPNPATHLISNDTATIGRNGNDYFNGEIREIVAYGRALKPNEINGIESYLITKWPVVEVKEGTGCNSSSPGYVSVTDGQWANGGDATNGNSIAVTCINGTTMLGGSIDNLSCTNGIYHGGTGSGHCGDANCGNPNILNPVTNGSWPVSSVLTGNTVNGNCNSGYSSTSAISMQCSLGSYINISAGVTTSCKASCNSSSTGFVNVTNATWSGSSNATHGNSISVSCNSGYTMSGSVSNLSCTNGVWGGGTGGGVCNPNGCTTASSGYVSPVTNGSWSASTATSGSSITKVCNSNYSPSGALNTLTCNAGTWTYTNSSGTCILTPQPSCKAILNAGQSTGNGVYTLASGIKVYCNMTTTGGGWTLVAAQYESDPVASWNEGIQSDYMINNAAFTASLLDSYSGIARGFTLSSSQLPTDRTQVAFGMGSNPTYVGYSNYVYITTNITTNSPSSNQGGVVVTNLKDSSSYRIYRATYIYNYHDIDRGIYTNTYTDGTLLTYERVGTTDLAYNWSFENVTGQPSPGFKGFAMLGERFNESNPYAWTIWVR